MFRHKNIAEGNIEETKTDNATVDLPTEADKTRKKEASVAEPPGLRELMEKNLKWAQIIYEQNRKINNKLLWSAIGNWLRVLLIIVPLALAILFLPPLLKKMLSQYGDLLGKAPATGTKQNSLENLLKLFNLDPAKQEQLKTLLK